MGDETQAFVESISNLPSNAYQFSIRPDETIYHVPYLVLNIKSEYQDKVFGWDLLQPYGLEISEIVMTNKGLWLETYLYNAEGEGRMTYEVDVPLEVFEKARKLIGKTKGCGTKFTDYSNRF